MKQKIIACFGIMTAMLGAVLAVGPLGTIQFVDAKDKSYCYDVPAPKDGSSFTSCFGTKKECDDQRQLVLDHAEVPIVISECYKFREESK